MNTFILTNTEAAFYIEEINNLMDDSLKKEYEFLPQHINFNFDPALIIAAPEAIYATLLIIKFGYDTIRNQLKKGDLKNIPNIISVQIIEDKNTYRVETTSNNINIKLEHKNNITELGIIKSTHFSYIIAESISQACMNSLIYNDIINFIKGELTHFSKSKNPDFCFQIILKELDRNMLLELIDYCNSQNNDVNSDINNERYWENNIKPEQFDALNYNVYKASSDFLAKRISNIELLTLDDIKNNSLLWFSQLNDFLMITYGDIGFHISHDFIHPYILTNKLILDLECIDTSKIYNRPYFKSNKSLPSNDSIGMNYKPEHNRLKLHTYLCEYSNYDNNGNWYQFNSNGTIHDDAYFHYKQLKNILSQNPLFVIGVFSEIDTSFSLKNKIHTLYKELKTLCRHSNTKIKTFNRYNVMFYMFGKFSQWLDFLVENNKVKFHILHINDENNPTFGVTKNFAMIAFYASTLPGIFIKCFNTINYSHVLLILNSLTKQKLIAPDYSNEGKVIGQKMKQAFDAIDALWLEY